jgi:hypothetical protein
MLGVGLMQVLAEGFERHLLEILEDLGILAEVFTARRCGQDTLGDLGR